MEFDPADRGKRIRADPEFVMRKKDTVIPGESRGILPRKLKGNFHGIPQLTLGMPALTTLNRTTKSTMFLGYAP